MHVEYPKSQHVWSMESCIIDTSLILTRLPFCNDILVLTSSNLIVSSRLYNCNQYGGLQLKNRNILIAVSIDNSNSITPLLCIPDWQSAKLFVISLLCWLRSISMPNAFGLANRASLKMLFELSILEYLLSLCTHCQVNFVTINPLTSADTSTRFARILLTL